jgi:RNA polymerase sigma-70 factor (ECF subfamily)
MQGAVDPEDLTSDVFVAMVRSIHTFDGSERAFRAWLFSIAHHRLLDDRRLAGRRELPADPAQITGKLSESLVRDVENEAFGRLGTDESSVASPH